MSSQKSFTFMITVFRYKVDRMESRGVEDSLGGTLVGGKGRHTSSDICLASDCRMLPGKEEKQCLSRTNSNRSSSKWVHLRCLYAVAVLLWVHAPNRSNSGVITQRKPCHRTTKTTPTLSRNIADTNNTAMTPCEKRISFKSPFHPQRSHGADVMVGQKSPALCRTSPCACACSVSSCSVLFRESRCALRLRGGVVGAGRGRVLRGGIAKKGRGRGSSRRGGRGGARGGGSGGRGRGGVGGGGIKEPGCKVEDEEVESEGAGEREGAGGGVWGGSLSGGGSEEEGSDAMDRQTLEAAIYMS